MAVEGPQQGGGPVQTELHPSEAGRPPPVSPGGRAFPWRGGYTEVEEEEEEHQDEGQAGWSADRVHPVGLPEPAYPLL